MSKPAPTFRLSPFWTILVILLLANIGWWGWLLSTGAPQITPY